MMSSRQVARCSRCGTIVDPEIMSRSKCPKCQVDLRSCVQCVNFDPGASLECTKKIPARISPKDVANECKLLFRPHLLGARNHRGREPEPERANRREEGLRRSLQILTGSA